MKRQALILGVLVVVMVAVYANALRPKPSAVSNDQPPVMSDVPAETHVASPSPVMTERPDAAFLARQRALQRERAVTLAWGRDPFVHSTAMGELSGLSVSGILWDPTKPIAIINGAMVHVGEEIEGYQVLAIDQDRVSVTDGTQTFQLPVAP